MFVLNIVSSYNFEEKNNPTHARRRRAKYTPPSPAGPPQDSCTLRDFNFIQVFFKLRIKRRLIDIGKNGLLLKRKMPKCAAFALLHLNIPKSPNRTPNKIFIKKSIWVSYSLQFYKNVPKKDIDKNFEKSLKFACQFAYKFSREHFLTT
jgi:hypothetical protein